ncbi:cation:proton antiporter [Microbacterium sp. nov. GSS16]|uniref:cation:proton antiporter n=1 Tax=Microbacterium sp. nov. GSS16 TaxID=3019890 RepID=UPI002305FEF4|nr:cation:proton antiporter [Microbacterium sp. nov. GSS16]WCD93776.1 cation:proton antiporter [Microbacterium sp. nov. GSS16]
MESSIFFIVVGAVAVAAVARRRGWPAPLLVTVVALLASFLPFVPDVAIDGHVLLNVVLPPLLYSAALDVSFLSFRRAIPQIRRLGVGLVVVTAVVVGVLAWWIMPALTLPGALLLGAIVAPPDAVSAASIGRRLGLPRRVMTVLSGESLINDATSLTMFRAFAAIVAGATVSLWDGIWQFALAVMVGIAVGLVFGIVLHQLRMRVDDPVVNGTFGLLAPFGAYAIAEQLLGSGVLAVVAMGLFVGFNAPKTSYATRQQEAPLWLSADFLLESFVFAYIGLQLPRVVGELKDGEGDTIVLLAVVVLVAVLLVRPLFVYPAGAWGQRWTKFRLRRWEKMSAAKKVLPIADGPGHRHPLTEDQLRRRLTETRLSWRDHAVVSWAGMRGVVTLATALAAADLAGLDAVASHAIVVVAFVVTVGTLLLQGLTLPWLIRVLGVVDDEEAREDARQLESVRERSREVGKAYLREARRAWAQEYGEDQLPAFDAYAERLVRMQAGPGRADEGPARPSPEQFAAMAKGWLSARRDLLLEERRAGNLSEEVMHELIAAMDAEELALDTRMALRT